MKTRLYIAGPMTGVVDFNLPAFARAKDELDALGYDAVNPGAPGVIPSYTWSDYMRAGLKLLLTCDGVAMLPGWSQSRGASLEVFVARRVGMLVHPIDYWVFCCATVNDN